MLEIDPQPVLELVVHVVAHLAEGGGEGPLGVHLPRGVSAETLPVMQENVLPVEEVRAVAEDAGPHGEVADGEQVGPQGEGRIAVPFFMAALWAGDRLDRVRRAGGLQGLGVARLADGGLTRQEKGVDRLPVHLAAEVGAGLGERGLPRRLLAAGHEEREEVILPGERRAHHEAVRQAVEHAGGLDRPLGPIVVGHAVRADGGQIEGASLRQENRGGKDPLADLRHYAAGIRQDDANVVQVPRGQVDVLEAVGPHARLAGAVGDDGLLLDHAVVDEELDLRSGDGGALEFVGLGGAGPQAGRRGLFADVGGRAARQPAHPDAGHLHQREHQVAHAERRVADGHFVLSEPVGPLAPVQLHRRAVHVLKLAVVEEEGRLRQADLEPASLEVPPERLPHVLQRELLAALALVHDRILGIAFHLHEIEAVVEGPGRGETLGQGGLLVFGPDIGHRDDAQGPHFQFTVRPGLELVLVLVPFELDAQDLGHDPRRQVHVALARDVRDGHDEVDVALGVVHSDEAAPDVEDHLRPALGLEGHQVAVFRLLQPKGPQEPEERQEPLAHGGHDHVQVRQAQQLPRLGAP